MMTGMGVTPAVWHSGPHKEMREEKFRLAERELLQWAGVDLNTKVI